ncbi:MAG: hypothetical protein QXU40_03040 [Candidatus Pacearchaeota archaeon]
MENIVLELVKQIPALVVLVWLVIQFTRTIKEVVQAFREEIKRINGVIERNTEVLSHVKTILTQKGKINA